MRRRTFYSRLFPSSWVCQKFNRVAGAAADLHDYLIRPISLSTTLQFRAQSELCLHQTMVPWKYRRDAAILPIILLLWVPLTLLPSLCKMHKKSNPNQRLPPIRTSNMKQLPIKILQGQPLTARRGLAPTEAGHTEGMPHEDNSVSP